MELLACIFKSEDKSQFSIVKKKKQFSKTMSKLFDKKEMNPRFEFL